MILSRIRSGLARRDERSLPGPDIPEFPPSSKVMMPGSGGAPYPTLVSIIETYRSAGPAAPMLMFGDSVAERISRHDEDRRNLAEMLAERLSPTAMLALTRSAHNPQIYRWLMEALRRQKQRPRLVILPINLRCFSPQWHLNPDWQFTQETEIIRRYLADPEGAIAPVADILFDGRQHFLFDRTPVNLPLSSLRSMGAFRALVRSEPDAPGRRERSREIFVLHYTMPLTPLHPRLVDLRRCVELARALGLELMCYLTPINIEAGARFAGGALRSAVAESAAFLAAMLRQDGLELIDWSAAFGEDAFFHEDFATEHLNQAGRARLAERVAESAQAKLARAGFEADTTS